MNFLLHRHKSPSHIVQVPDGLRELMTDISREVLRSQPKNVLKFVADYLEALLITRDCIYCAQNFVDLLNSSTLPDSGISQEQANRGLQKEWHMTCDQAEKTVNILEIANKKIGSLAVKNTFAAHKISRETVENAAIKIQSKYRSFRAQKKLKELKLKRYREVEAATKIQAFYKGHLARIKFTV